MGIAQPGASFLPPPATPTSARHSYLRPPSLPPSVIPAQAGIHPWALKLRGFHQKAYAPHALPFVGVQPEGQAHPGRQ